MNVSASEIVDACAEHRTQTRRAADNPLTIPEAIDLALWIRKTPDCLISHDRLRQLADGLLSALQKYPVYLRAMQAEQDVFVLIDRDRAAPAAIQRWAETADEHGCAPDKVNEAYRKAARWTAQSDAVTRWPD